MQILLKPIRKESAYTCGVKHTIFLCRGIVGCQNKKDKTFDMFVYFAALYVNIAENTPASFNLKYVLNE